jgi:hypothetical protein
MLRRIGNWTSSAAILGGMTIVAAFVWPGQVRAQDGTPAQRNACKPDVFRLCAEFIPDRDAITACLERNVPKLNPDCRAVFARKK